MPLPQAHPHAHQAQQLRVTLCTPPLPYQSCSACLAHPSRPQLPQYRPTRRLGQHPAPFEQYLQRHRYPNESQVFHRWQLCWGCCSLPRTMPSALFSTYRSIFSLSPQCNTSKHVHYFQSPLLILPSRLCSDIAGCTCRVSLAFHSPSWPEWQPPKARAVPLPAWQPPKAVPMNRRWHPWQNLPMTAFSKSTTTQRLLWAGSLRGPGAHSPCTNVLRPRPPHPPPQCIPMEVHAPAAGLCCCHPAVVWLG